ncbi:UNVERIFIED_CONTAM: hypothetical protein RMT77_012314 [Armadillidium vulgare]
MCLTVNGINIFRVKFWFLLFCNFHFLMMIENASSSNAKSQGKSNALESSPVLVVRGVLGGRALLPCDINPPTPTDAPILVLFYVENKKTPIYSLDSRDSSLYSAYHWCDPELEDRVDMQVDYGNQGLLLHRIRSSDEGLYRCRVDFKASPTRNSRVRLDVIEPPRHMLITSKWKDERVVSKVAGPFPEGAEVLLSCQVMGGKPSPKVTWWHEGSMLDDVTETRTNQMTRNSLQLPPMTRDDLLKNLTCQAVNSNLTSPLSSTVSVDLAFPPTNVRIRRQKENGYSRPSEVGQKVIVVTEGEKNFLTCDVEGSRPQALIHWDIDGTNVNEKYETITSPKGGKKLSETAVISSTLVLIPRAFERDSTVTCRALNPLLPDQMLFDTAKLNVLYKPRVSLSEGKKIDLDDVKEGNDIYFECQVDANPSATKIVWARNNTPLYHNSSEGVLLSSTGTSLILQDVTRAASGTYTCMATNSKGSTTSNTLSMKVKYIPVCGSTNESTVGGGLQEMVKATCNAKSHPPADKFRWAFNSSRGLQDITNSPNVKYNDSNRVIQYKIKSTDDFGAFLCWASNSLGDMKDPCVINVIPAAKPEPVSDCEIFHNSSIPGGQVTVQCVSGWNGGLSQSFTLEVRKTEHLHTKVLSALEQSIIPYFKIRDLQTETEYLFTVTASNSRGSSEPVTLLYTVPGEVIAGLTHARTDPQKALEKMMPLIAVVLSIVMTIGISVLVVFCIVRTKIKNRKNLQKKERFTDSLQQDDSSLRQTSTETFTKEKESSSDCNSLTRYDAGGAAEGRTLNSKERQRMTPSCHEIAMKCSTNPARRIPNYVCFEREKDVLLSNSNNFYGENVFGKGMDVPATLGVPPLAPGELQRDEQNYLEYDYPSNSLGRASTLSSGSSTSRPTFRSSQSTVIFNPKYIGEDTSKLTANEGGVDLHNPAISKGEMTL